MLDLAYAMGSSGGAEGVQQNPIGVLLPFIVIFIIFYFLLIRPQKKQQKKHQEMIANLKKNDKIITSGGINGIIVSVKDKSVVVKVDDNTKLEVQKNFIAKVIEK